MYELIILIFCFLVKGAPWIIFSAFLLDFRSISLSRRFSSSVLHVGVRWYNFPLLPRFLRHSYPQPWTSTTSVCIFVQHELVHRFRTFFEKLVKKNLSGRKFKVNARMYTLPVSAMPVPDITLWEEGEFRICTWNFNSLYPPPHFKIFEKMFLTYQKTFENVKTFKKINMS